MVEKLKSKLRIQNKFKKKKDLVCRVNLPDLQETNIQIQNHKMLPAHKQKFTLEICNSENQKKELMQSDLLI